RGYISDGTVAELLKKLKAKNPRAIGLDIYRNLPFEPGHEELVKVFKSTKYLIGIQKVVGYNSTDTVDPPPVLKKLGQVAANDMIHDDDNTMRRGLLYLNKNGETFYSFNLYLALLYLEKEGIEVEEVKGEEGNIWKLGHTVFKRLQPNDGSYVMPKADGYQILLNYRGPQGYFKTVSLRDILEDKVPKDWGRDRIILIGYIGESFKDLFFTPYTNKKDLFSAFYKNKNESQLTPGVEIQGHLISQILSAAIDNRPLIKSWSEPQECLWILFWSGFGAIVTWKWRYAGKSEDKSTTIKTHQFKSTYLLRAITLVLTAIILLASTYIAFVWGWWLPVVTPFLAFTGSAVAITTYIAHTAESIRKIFGRYLTDEVVSTLLESPEGLKLGGKRQTLTVLTSDLRGFTALSELLDPEIVVQILNIYLEYMLDAIASYQGTIDKFMGDGIVVIFGAPTNRKDDAQRAVGCAVSMQMTMDTVNDKLEKLGLPVLEMGIGINTGEVVVGNIGSEKHTEYTVIGKEMNLAFRIETYSSGGQILISETTLTEIGKENLIINGDKQIKPKGVKEPITIYDIRGIKEPYNISIIPEEEKFLHLSNRIPLQYILVDGKQIGDTIIKGYLVQISEKGGVIYVENQTENPIPLPMSNIKLNFLSSHNQHQQEMSDDIYAKVLDKPSFEQVFYIRFTFKPPAVAKKLLKLLMEELKKP
ncbi:MAG: CHASE2 domain-containing protein, partial [Sphaerospermopsis kisseleviana]